MLQTRFYSVSLEKSEFDVVIVGGGPAGSSIRGGARAGTPFVRSPRDPDRSNSQWHAAPPTVARLEVVRVLQGDGRPARWLDHA